MTAVNRKGNPIMVERWLRRFAMFTKLHWVLKFYSIIETDIYFYFCGYVLKFVHDKQNYFPKPGIHTQLHIQGV